MNLLGQTAVFLAAAVIAVPLFRKAGLGAVLGYLAAGAAIGPWGLRLVQDVGSILHFAEFGVVLLLFIIGLELQPSRLWTMRQPVFGAGGAQVAASTAVIGGAALAFGLDWRAALVVGLSLSLSSTAFALQIMAEKGHLTTRYGRTAFSILLFQDLTAIPVLALVPLLGIAAVPTDGDTALLGVAKVTGVIVAVIVIGRLVLRQAFRLVARTGIREIFTASALLTVIGTALVMQSVGLSMALGAFLAGVLLADSEFRHALEADIDPFKGLLLGLFFIAVGMSVNFGLLATEIGPIAALVAGLVAVKAAILYGIGMAFRHDRRAAAHLAVAVSQGGEFAFVILNIAVGASVLPAAVSDLLILVVTLSMATTPLLYLLLERMGRARAADPPDFEMPPNDHSRVIIAGFGRFGQIVGRILQARHIPFTALEISPEQVDFVARYGNRVYYGDASRPDLLHAAGTGEAAVFVVAIDDIERSLHTAETVRAHFPKLRIVARARDRQHAYRLMDLGVETVVRETFHSGLEASRHTLEFLGMSSGAADRAVATFRAHDERRLAAQHGIHRDERRMVAEAQAWNRELEDIFAQDAADEAAAEAEGRAKT